MSTPHILRLAAHILRLATHILRPAAHNLRPATLALCWLFSAISLQPLAFSAGTGTNTGASTGAPMSLESGFDQPPATARPLTWWHWISGNITKTGITADLTAMKEAGIAGVQLFDAGIYLPDGPVRYGTDNWHDHVQFAIREAARLGLDVSLMNTPGWSASGGPWVTPGRSMKKLVWTETEITIPAGNVAQVAKPASSTLRLPQPETRENFYRDIAVLAVPSTAAPNLLAPANLAAAANAAAGAGIASALIPALDDDPDTAAVLPAAGSHVLNFTLRAPVTATRLSLRLVNCETPFKGHAALRASDDGKTYRVVQEFQLADASTRAAPATGAETQAAITFKPVTARHWRVSIATTKAPGEPAAFSIAELALTHDTARSALPPNQIRMSAAPVPRQKQAPASTGSGHGHANIPPASAATTAAASTTATTAAISTHATTTSSSHAATTTHAASVATVNLASATVTTGADLAPALDDDPSTAASFPAAGSHVINLALHESATATRLVLRLTQLPRPFRLRAALRVSDDGRNFTVVKEWTRPATNAGADLLDETFPPVTARYFRVSLAPHSDGQPTPFALAELSLFTPTGAGIFASSAKTGVDAAKAPRAAKAASTATSATSANATSANVTTSANATTPASATATAAAAGTTNNLLASVNLASATVTTGADLAPALDDAPSTAASFPAAGSHVINLALHEPATATRLVLRLTQLPHPFRLRAALRASDDGQNFTVVKEWTRPATNVGADLLDETFPPVTARHFRVSLAPHSNGQPTPFALAELSLISTKTAAKAPRAAKPPSNTAPANIGAATTANAPAILTRADIHDLTAFMKPDGAGTLALPAGALPPGRYTIIRFGYTSTGAKNHPAVPEGHGLEIDKLDPDAVAFQFEQSVGRIIRDAGPLAGKTLTGILFDSFEAGYQNWTDTFPAQFRALHGYDLVPLLPLVTGRVIESPAFADCVLHDFRSTINRAIRDNYIGVMQRLAHAHGIKLYCESYGGPLVAPVNAPRIDILMAEFWLHSRFPARLKFYASAANLLDKPIVAAEALTARPEEDGWGASLPALKRPGDHAFASGINRFALHTYAHQPRESAPGFTLGRYGTRFNRLNTWWPHMRAWTDYIARSQFLLQQGWRHADILLLQNEDIGNAFPIAELTRLPAGYDCDFAYPDNLPAMRVENGAITLPHGPRWRVVVTPAFPWAADIATLRWLRDAVRAGILLIGNPPECPAGLADLRRQTDFDALVAELWGGLAPGQTPEKHLGAGAVTRAPIADALRAHNIPRDLAIATNEQSNTANEQGNAANAPSPSPSHSPLPPSLIPSLPHSRIPSLLHSLIPLLPPSPPPPPSPAAPVPTLPPKLPPAP